MGRVVLFSRGPHEGRLATIVEIIDHKRVRSFPGLPKNKEDERAADQVCIQVLVDGPASKPEAVVPRHATPISNVVLTPLVITTLPRGARNGVVRKEWETAEVEKKWSESTWAKKREQKTRRRQLSDFDRFKVMRLRKLVSYEMFSFPGRTDKFPATARQGWLGTANVYCLRVTCNLQLLTRYFLRLDSISESLLPRSEQRRNRLLGLVASDGGCATGNCCIAMSKLYFKPMSSI